MLTSSVFSLWKVRQRPPEFPSRFNRPKQRLSSALLSNPASDSDSKEQELPLSLDQIDESPAEKTPERDPREGQNQPLLTTVRNKVDTSPIGMETNCHETAVKPSRDCDSQPPMALSQFIEQTALSRTTVWRFRKKGFLRTINICGRHYVLRSEIARFNARAVTGEFARTCNQPMRERRGAASGR
jgi:hypothetical protein